MEVTLYVSLATRRPFYRYRGRDYDAATGLAYASQVQEVIPGTELILSQEELEHGFVSQPFYLLSPRNEWNILVTSPEGKFYAPYYSSQEIEEMTIIPIKVPRSFDEDHFEEYILPRTTAFRDEEIHYEPMIALQLGQPGVFYLVNNYYLYDARTLERVSPQDYPRRRTIVYFVEQPYSNPLLINFVTGNYLVVAADGWESQIIAQSRELEELVPEMISSVEHLIYPVVEGTTLRSAERPPFALDIGHAQPQQFVLEFPEFLDFFHIPNVMRDEMPTLEDGPIDYHEMPELEPARKENVKYVESILEALISRLYQLEVELPKTLPVAGIEASFLTFDEVTEKFKRGEIIKYLIEPLHQVWAGPIGTKNRIITLYTVDGMIYLVKVRYDQQSNQIFPPV